MHIYVRTLQQARQKEVRLAQQRMQQLQQQVSSLGMPAATARRIITQSSSSEGGSSSDDGGSGSDGDGTSLAPSSKGLQKQLLQPYSHTRAEMSSLGRDLLSPLPKVQRLRPGQQREQQQQQQPQWLQRVQQRQHQELHGQHGQHDDEQQQQQSSSHPLAQSGAFVRGFQVWMNPEFLEGETLVIDSHHGDQAAHQHFATANVQQD